MFRLPSFHPKVLLWRAATNIGPLPVLVRARSLPYGRISGGPKGARQRSRLCKEYALAGLACELLRRPAAGIGGRTRPECRANLQAIWRADRNIKLYGVELNDNAVKWGMQHMPEGCGAKLLTGSMADVAGVLQRNGIEGADVVFSCGATMHVNDEIFAAAKQQALKLARKAIIHVEYNAWTPAELQNGRNWRSSFLSDRWVRDYVAEYESMPGVSRVDCIRIPPEINVARNIGRLWINDMTAMIVVHRN
ncbi:hypothetical protein ACQ5SK_03255 [Bradyrhizobium japonicum]